MGLQQQRLLRRHLQEVRQQEAQSSKQPRQLQQGGTSSSSGGGSVGPNELRIGPVFQLSGIGGNEARRIEKQLVPAAIKVLQKYLQVSQQHQRDCIEGVGGDGDEGGRGAAMTRPGGLRSSWCLQPSKCCKRICR